MKAKCQSSVDHRLYKATTMVLPKKLTIDMKGMKAMKMMKAMTMVLPMKVMGAMKAM